VEWKFFWGFKKEVQKNNGLLFDGDLLVFFWYRQKGLNHTPVHKFYSHSDAVKSVFMASLGFSRKKSKR